MKTKSGQLVVGACIETYPRSDTQDFGAAFFTDKRGRYSFTLNTTHRAGGSGPGRYQLKIYPCGATRFAPEWWRGENSYSQDLPTMDAYPGQTVTYNITVRDESRIEGQIRYAPGAPMSGGCARVAQDDSDIWFPPPAPADSGGHYVLHDLAPGTHRIFAGVNCSLVTGYPSPIAMSPPYPIGLAAAVSVREGRALVGQDFTATR